MVIRTLTLSPTFSVSLGMMTSRFTVSPICASAMSVLFCVNSAYTAPHVTRLAWFSAVKDPKRLSDCWPLKKPGPGMGGGGVSGVRLRFYGGGGGLLSGGVGVFCLPQKQKRLENN